MKAIITRVETMDKNRPPRYKVGITTDKTTIVSFLIRGPWCKSTAREKRRELQRDIDAGRIRLPRRYRLAPETLSDNEKRQLEFEAS